LKGVKAAREQASGRLDGAGKSGSHGRVYAEKTVIGVSFWQVAQTGSGA